MDALTLEGQVSNGQLVLGPGQFAHHAARFGPRNAVSDKASIAARVAKARGGHPPVTGGLHTPASKTIAVGEAPAGFGKWVEWHDSGRDLALTVVFRRVM